MLHRILPLTLLSVFGWSQTPLLLQKPALSRTHIVFTYAGDLWSVARSGGEAIRLTTAPGIESEAVFSPDGRTVAFSGAYDGNVDIYTVPVAGGVPKRLTWHPGQDAPLAYSADGKLILFRSARAVANRGSQLFTMAVEGGPATPLPLPSGEQGAWSPDAKRIAYTPLAPAFLAWKRYAGGRTSPIWLASLADSSIERVPRVNSNDYYPMWSGDKVFFLSDRFGPMTLCSYDTKSKKVAQAIANNGLDYKSASLGPDAIVLERFGGIELYDLKSGKAAPVAITLNGDLPGVRPYYDKVASKIQNYSLSPTGARALFEARGEILTVPAEKGDVRNLTSTSHAAERFPAWSPDGQRIAWFSDESGEYQLHIAPQNGAGEVQKIDLGVKAFYYFPTWSPDGKKILFRDSNLTLSYIDLATKKVTRIDADYYDVPDRDDVNPSWSPDSKWIVYNKLGRNFMRAVHVYSLESGKSTQVSDGLSDQRHAVWDKGGRHIYFTASTNTGLSTGWLDMSSIDRPVHRSVYVVVLRNDDPSPLAPESDEEKPEVKKDEKKDAAKPDAAKPEDVRIDFDSIGQRILALPGGSKSYYALAAGKAGTLFLLEGPALAPQGPPALTLHKYDAKTRKTEKFLDGLRGFDISFNGEKILYRQGERYLIAGTSAPPKAGEGAIKTDQMEVRVDPVAEWTQIYNEVWRIERDYFYDPGLHGVNLADFKARYAKFLPGIAHRADLNYLFSEMLGELSVGHLYVGGGAMPDVKSVPVGLLGADYAVENGRYRFARIYNGENWNPSLRAPLTAPGVNVKAGDYLLAVNGRDVKSTDEIYSYFEATAGKATLLKVGPNANGEGAREVTVVPVGNDGGLRYMAWVEDNRRKVDQLSGGRLGYVHLPNTAEQGYENFNRWFFAQMGREGFVLDERFNGGGQVADYIVDYLRRPLLNYFMTRAGNPFTTPMNGVYGPKAMIVNEWAGSGGDAMPWMFKKLKIGPLIGKRTWGGLVGIFGFPSLLDGGRVTAPNLAFYNTEKQWDVENHGTDPDIEVEFDPAEVRKGRDPQLEKAVEVLLETLKKNPLPKHERPEFPNYHKPKP